ncbi:T9SS type A sorting domain-containing protein [Flavobacterium ovatum]
MPALTNQKIDLTLGHLNPGVYFLVLETEKTSQKIKVIKQ